MTAVTPHTATRRRVRWAPAAALAGAVAAIVAAMALVTGPDKQPVAGQAAALAREPATAPAPASTGAVLRADVDGVRFPDWDATFGWRETGSRRDTLDGRATETVFYEHMGHRIAYTILRAPVDPPEGSQSSAATGWRSPSPTTPATAGHDIAVFERGGRTCVIAGHVERVETLVKLAAWTGGGAVPS